MLTEAEVGRRETRACHKAVPDGSYYYLSALVLTALLTFRLVSCSAHDTRTWQDLSSDVAQSYQAEFNGLNFRNELIAADKNRFKRETLRYRANEMYFLTKYRKN